MTFEIVSIHDLPLYNGDLEAAGVPPAVKAFTDKVWCPPLLVIWTI